MNTSTEISASKVNWRQVGLFVGLTFGFTFALDLALQLLGGYGVGLTMLFLQLQMFLPAFFAIILGLFVFKDSPFYFHHPMPDGRRDRARGFFFLYIAITVSYVVLAVLAALLPGSLTTISQLAAIPLLLGLLGLILFRVIGGRDAFARANLRGGRFIDWVIYGGGIVLFMALQAGLNALFQLGTPVNPDQLAAQMGVKMPGNVFQAVFGVQMILQGSLIGLIIAFGEEYGWRAFLQSQLIRMGKKRGVLVLGLIWGAWHYPVIWMGHNYPGQPVWGTLLMTIFCILLAYVLGYAMLKTGSIWLVAFMHAILDQAANYFSGVIYRPADAIFSFGVGIYGMACVAIIVALMLRDPVWKDNPAVEGQVDSIPVAA